MTDTQTTNYSDNRILTKISKNINNRSSSSSDLENRNNKTKENTSNNNSSQPSNKIPTNSIINSDELNQMFLSKNGPIKTIKNYKNNSEDICEEIVFKKESKKQQDVGAVITNKGSIPINKNENNKIPNFDNNFISPTINNSNSMFNPNREDTSNYDKNFCSEMALSSEYIESDTKYGKIKNSGYLNNPPNDTCNIMNSFFNNNGSNKYIVPNMPNQNIKNQNIIINKKENNNQNEKTQTKNYKNNKSNQQEEYQKFNDESIVLNIKPIDRENEVKDKYKVLVQEAMYYKRIGNDLFNKKNYLKSVDYYKKSLMILNHNSNFKDYQSNVTGIKIDCLNNIAISFLLKNEYQKVLDFTSQVSYFIFLLKFNQKIDFRLYKSRRKTIKVCL